MVRRGNSISRPIDFVKQEVRRQEIAKMKQDLLFITMHKNILSKKQFEEKMAQLNGFSVMHDDEFVQENDEYRKLKAEM